MDNAEVEISKDTARGVIRQVEKLLKIIEKRVDLLKTLRWMMLKKLYPDMRWDTDKYEYSHYSVNVYDRPIARRALRQFALDEQKEV